MAHIVCKCQTQSIFEIFHRYTKLGKRFDRNQTYMYTAPPCLLKKLLDRIEKIYLCFHCFIWLFLFDKRDSRSGRVVTSGEIRCRMQGGYMVGKCYEIAGVKRELANRHLKLNRHGNLCRQSSREAEKHLGGSCKCDEQSVWAQHMESTILATLLARFPPRHSLGSGRRSLTDGDAVPVEAR